MKYKDPGCFTISVNIGGTCVENALLDLGANVNMLPYLMYKQLGDECKTHLCFEFISHAILCILYPYSCKTDKYSSNLGFVGLLMKSK